MIKSKIQKLQDDIFRWSTKTFGANRSIPGLIHLKEEVDETIEAIHNAEKDSHSPNLGRFCIEMQYADCLILLLDSMAHNGFSVKEIVKDAELKMKVNKEREWFGPDENGCYHHQEQK